MPVSNHAFFDGQTNQSVKRWNMKQCSMKCVCECVCIHCSFVSIFFIISKCLNENQLTGNSVNRNLLFFFLPPDTREYVSIRCGSLTGFQWRCRSYFAELIVKIINFFRVGLYKATHCVCACATHNNHFCSIVCLCACIYTTHVSNLH